jgi:hypothetical protein
MAGFNGNEFILHRASNSLRKNLIWWETQLFVPNFYRQLRPLGPLQDLHIYVDASTSWGIGIIIGESWAAFQLAADWKVLGLDICWLEAVALELLVYFLAQLNFSQVHLLIHSDNNGAIGAHSKGRSGNNAINLCVRRTYAVLAEHLIVPKFKYIESALNPSDPISRGESGPSHRRLAQSFDLPWELSNIFVDLPG